MSFMNVDPKSFCSNLFPQCCNHLCGMKCSHKDQLVDEQTLATSAYQERARKVTMLGITIDMAQAES
jgi:hypothetical protein